MARSTEYRDTTAIDLLDTASSMLEFLIDAVPAAGNETLSESSVFGLQMIITHINTTIGQARKLI